jgi:hypothetical protein
VRGDGDKSSLNNGETFGLKILGFHTTATGGRYELQFDPEGKLAQAVLRPKGDGAGHLVLAFRAGSKKEALKMLIEELDKGSH